MYLSYSYNNQPTNQPTNQPLINAGCTRRNVPYFRRTRLRLNYFDIIKHTSISSWTAVEIMSREKCGTAAVPHTATV
jgi:hypothetical protein